MHYDIGQYFLMFSALFQIYQHIRRVLKLFYINRRMPASANISLDFVAQFQVCQRIQHSPMLFNVSRRLTKYINISSLFGTTT
jgi:hypothetical protein